MLKVLEKYKKYVLVIGGSLLMVAFIMPSAVSQMHGDPGKRVLGYIGSQKFRMRDDSLARRELALLKNVASGWIGALGVQNELHWMLLAHEAQGAGFVGAQTDGEMYLAHPDLIIPLAQQIARQRYGEGAQFYWSIPQTRAEMFDIAQKALPNMAKSAQRDVQMTDKEAFTTLAKLRGVLRMVGAFEGAGRLSDRRTLLAAERIDSFYGVDSLVIPASRLIDRVPEPSQEDVQAHYEKYRDVQPGTGDNGIGYRQPDRVKFAYLFLDHMAIADSIKIDTVESHKRWKKEFPTKPPEEFAKDRAQIDMAMRQEKVALVMGQIDKIWRAQVLASTRRLDADGPYKRLSADWEKTRPTLDSIAQVIVEGVKQGMEITIPRPAIVVKDASWLTQSEAQRIPGFGRATVTVGNRQGQAWMVLFTTRELLEAGVTAPPTGIAVQAGVPIADAYAIDPSQNRYYFMVLDAAKAAAPGSLDEVRDQVVRGLKTVRAYDLLVADLPVYVDQAKAEGLEPIAKMFEIPPTAAENLDIVPVEIQPNVLVSADRVAGNDRRIMVDPFKEEVLRLGRGIDPLKSVDEVPAEQRTFSLALPASLSGVVTQIQSVEPLTYDKYRAIGDQVLRGEQTREMQAADPNMLENSPFTYAALKTRLKFRPVDGELDETPDEETPQKTAGKDDAKVGEKTGG